MNLASRIRGCAIAATVLAVWSLLNAMSTPAGFWYGIDVGLAVVDAFIAGWLWVMAQREGRRLRP